MTKAYIVDRALHWISSLLILFMLLNMGSQIHLLDYRVKGQIEHRQDAIEMHALVGAILLLVLVSRMVWAALFKAQIPRNLIQNKLHSRFISVIQFLLYAVVFALAVSGVMMAGESELSLHLLGLELSSPDHKNIKQYSQLLEIHLFFISVFWWLIGLHVAGAMYAKR